MSELAVEQTAWVPGDSFGLRLYALRKELGWTQGQAATVCDVDDGSWSNWENGARPRNMGEVVAKIADATKVSREWLMWGGPIIRWCSDDAGRGGHLTSISDVPGQLELAYMDRPSFALVP